MKRGERILFRQVGNFNLFMLCSKAGSMIVSWKFVLYCYASSQSFIQTIATSLKKAHSIMSSLLKLLHSLFSSAFKSEFYIPLREKKD
jgi:hypothetical protein